MIIIIIIIIIIIRPRASSPEGNVSDASDGSLTTLPLILNPLKGPQEGLAKFSGNLRLFGHVFFVLFCDRFLRGLGSLLGPTWRQLGANLGPFGANLGLTWVENGAQVVCK